ncbi:MAG: hypothetical protein AAGC73_00740 [Verrucomicrobiota bacterium]
MSDRKKSKVTIDLAEELTESENKKLRDRAESMDQSLEAHVLWVIERHSLRLGEVSAMRAGDAYREIEEEGEAKK